MRSVAISFLVISVLSACSMFGGEKVHSTYVGPAAMDQDQINRLLFEQGFRNVTGLHRNGNDWIGSAQDRDGQTVNFDIDKAGTVHTK